MEEGEEDDYMSDKFLFAAEEKSKSTLLTSHASRKIKREERIKERQNLTKTKPRKVEEKERRDDKLNTPLDESNRGFALLAKMGFKSGMGLGKNESGRSEPIPLNIKTDRGGVGQEQHVAERKTKSITARLKARARRERLNEELKGDFQSRMKDRFTNKQIERDLGRSQAACEQLDSVKGLSCIEPWYWRQPIKSEEDEPTNDDEEELDEEMQAADKLQTITTHLRTIHWYCIWCATTFTDADDLVTNCPGDTFEDHND